MRATAMCWVAVLGALGCSSTPPPNWASGGAPIVIGPARWHRGDDVYELSADGKVQRDGSAVFAIDRAGRVFESDGDPIAVLSPDGHLMGRDNTAMGYIGANSASLAGAETAWFTIGTRGEITRYDSDGDRSGDGYWEGCTGPVQRTCSLITHVVLLQEWQRRPRFGVGIGVGIGMGR